METQPSVLRAVHRRLFSRGIQFQNNAADLLDRLDDITYLINLRRSEPELGRDIHQMILSGLETIKDLSLYVKEFIFSLENDHFEFNLLKQMLRRQHRVAKVCEYEYVVGYEWAHYQFEPTKQVLEIHRGDLVLMNEDGSFLVIELKYIDPVPDFQRRWRRADRLRHVRRQTEKFRSIFQERFPWAQVEGMAVTNLVSYVAGGKKPLQWTKRVL